MPSTDNTPDRNTNTIRTSSAAMLSLTATQRRVAAALAEVHDATVIAITGLADVSKSSVAKTLALLEQSGAAIRTVREDDGIREADLWSPGPALGALLFTAGPEAPGFCHTGASETVEAVDLQSSIEISEGGAAEVPGERTVAAPAQVPQDAASECAASSDSPGVETGTTSGGERRRGTAVTPLAESVLAVEAVMTASSGPGESAPGGRAERLAPGELAAMVAAALAAHPDIEYTPTQLSHKLGRSAGAIHNVLEKMIASGRAVRTRDKPKSYRQAAPEPSNRP
jgi:DNA-binding MarR family transcriptional regulator